MPVKRRKNQALITLFSIGTILALDQSSKSLIRLRLTIGDSIPVIKNIFHITYVGNTGAAFGFFKNNTLIFVAISIIAISFISTLILRSIKKGKFLSNPLFDSGLILIVSGALGNLFDRIKYGYVIDFIDVRIWPVFNIADSSITIGTCLLMLFFMARPKQYNFTFW